jgi:DNA-binding NarL/FixJ family response regulator
LLPVIDVFVIAPVRVHRESLSIALDDSHELHVVGAAETISHALSRLRDLRPDVALIDASTPDVAPVAAPPTVADVNLVAVGVPEEEAVAWIEAGVSGYVPPDASLGELALVVARVARGELVTSREVRAHLLDRIRRPSAETPKAGAQARLTRREAQVLDLAAEGLPNKVIAQRLSIKVQTVKNHMQNILRKFGVHGRGAAAARMRHRRPGSPGQ